jgi:creatinine amidohydrolase
MSHVLPRQTAPEVDAGNPAHAVLPVGSFEQHGPYLPLITDTVVASLITGELAEAYGLFALPPVPVSCSHEHHAWRATVSVPSAVLAAYVSGISDSVAGSGFRSLVLVNGHGGNYVLANVVQEASATGRRMALFPAREDWRKARLDADLETSDHEDMHAGELETSILLHAAPDLVRAGYRSADHLADDRRGLLTTGVSAYTASGVIGKPSRASAEKGKALLESLTGSFARVLELLNRS